MNKNTNTKQIEIKPLKKVTHTKLKVTGTILANSGKSKSVPFAESSKIDTVYVDKVVEVKAKPDTVYLTKPCKKSHCDSESVKPPKIDSIQ
jgi:hypothetical protein